MKSSLISILKESVVAYKTTHRKDWVLDWAGQIVLAGSQIYWTTEVEEVGLMEFAVGKEVTPPLPAQRSQGGLSKELFRYVC